jgi:hypothetical protein
MPDFIMRMQHSIRRHKDARAPRFDARSQSPRRQPAAEIKALTQDELSSRDFGWCMIGFTPGQMPRHGLSGIEQVTI